MKQLLVFIGVLMLISSTVSLENNTNDKTIKKHEKRGALNYGFGLSQEQNNQYQIYGTPQQEQLQINEQNIADHSNENNHHNVFQQDHQNHILLPQNIPHVHPVPVAPVHNVPFALPQPVPIVPPVVPQTIIKPVGIPYPVHVEKIVDRPYPVAVPVPKYIEKIVHVDRPVAVPIEKHIHVPVDRPYAVPVPVYKDRPIHVPQPYPVHVAVPVLKPYPVPVAVQYKSLPHHHHHHLHHHQQQQQQQQLFQGW